MPEAATQICRLDGTCEPAAGDTLEITTDPILVRFSRLNHIGGPCSRHRMRG
jgi:hypothetical protein